MRTIVIAGALIFTVSACSIVETGKKAVVNKAFDVAGEYCKADQGYRDQLRKEFSTDKGPVFTVNCENL